MAGFDSLHRLSETVWEIPVTYKEGMQVPARLYGTEPLVRAMDEAVYDQITNVATLPGIAQYAMCMPDGHSGYGFPIGGVAAMDVGRGGVISPGGIGFDINCGMRLVVTNLTQEEVTPHLETLVDRLFVQVPAGVGSTGFVTLSRREFRRVIEEGARWCIRQGYGWEEDLELTEEAGCMTGADASKISDKAIDRGYNQIGTLGSGNHYLEIQVVRPEHITEPLGSGKTTLLRHIVATVPRRLAILMNEFGEIAIDSKIITGTNVHMAELGGGCVCCALLGEFEAAVHEILATVAPAWIVVETTGVAEPDALVLDIEDNIPAVRLDGVVTVTDADALVRFPQLGHTTRLQIEAADLLVLNKADLVSAAELEAARTMLARLRPAVLILPTQRCQVDPALLVGLTPGQRLTPQRHVHQPEFESVSYTTTARLDRSRFEAFIAGLHPTVHRAKGLVRFCTETCLFNFVAGRWEMEPFPVDDTTLVFIGKHLSRQRAALQAALIACEQ